MKKRIIVFMLALMLCVLPTVSAFANVSTQPRLADGAGLLSSSEAQKVEEKLNKVSREWDIDVVVITTKENTFGDIDAFGENAISAYSGDIAAYVIDMSARDWTLLTKAGASNAFTKYGRQYLGEQVAKELSAGKYAKAFLKFADMTDDYMNEATRSKPYDEGNLPKDFNWVIAIVIAVVVGLIAGAIRIAVLNGELHSVALKTEASECIKEGSFKLTSQREVFLTRKVERRLVAQQNGSNNTQQTRSGNPNGNSASGKF